MFAQKSIKLPKRLWYIKIKVTKKLINALKVLICPENFQSADELDIIEKSNCQYKELILPGGKNKIDEFTKNIFI